MVFRALTMVLLSGMRSMYRQVQTKVSRCLAQRAQVFPTMGCSFHVRVRPCNGAKSYSVLETSVEIRTLKQKGGLLLLTQDEAGCTPYKVPG